MAEMLKDEDVKRLLARPDTEVRAEIAGKIAAQHAGLTEQQRAIAEDIFRIMVKDAEVRVREALSRQLKDSPLLPRDVALALARDVDAVALPILEFSDVLSEADLIELVKSQDDAKLDAMARRAHVPEGLSDALVERGVPRVVSTLVRNQGARISETTLSSVVDRFAGSSPDIGDALAARPGLPVTIVERLLTHVSESFRNHLMARTDLSPDVAATLLIQARELAVLGISNTETDVPRLISHLHRNGRLTPSIILRAVCMGDLTFFETALAKLANISLDNAQALIHDQGKRGFEALFRKCGLPEALYPAMRAAIDVARDMQYDGEAGDRERFSRRMIERILTQYGDLGVEIKNDDLEYLLARMGQLHSGAMRAE